MTLVVNLFGGPGTGKSTTRAGIFHNLKLESINCEEAPEWVKDVVWEGRNTILENQVYIFAKQSERLRRLNHKVDVIITDSPLLLSSIYGNTMSQSFHSLVREIHDSYDNINVWLTRKKPYVTAGRMQTEEEAEYLDQQIREFLDEHKVVIHYEENATKFTAGIIAERVLDKLRGDD